MNYFQIAARRLRRKPVTGVKSYQSLSAKYIYSVFLYPNKLILFTETRTTNHVAFLSSGTILNGVRDWVVHVAG